MLIVRCVSATATDVRTSAGELRKCTLALRWCRFRDRRRKFSHKWRGFHFRAGTCLSLKKVDSQINLEMGRTSDNHAKYYNEVVRLYFEEGLGSQKLAHIIPVSRSTILRWIRTFVRDNPGYQMQQPIIPKHEDPKAIEAMRREKEEKAEIKALKEEIGRLQTQLRRAEMRADVYDEMINVAERQFNIPIRKKPGAK